MLAGCAGNEPEVRPVCVNFDAGAIRDGSSDGSALSHRIFEGRRRSGTENARVAVRAPTTDRLRSNARC